MRKRLDSSVTLGPAVQSLKLLTRMSHLAMATPLSFLAPCKFIVDLRGCADLPRDYAAMVRTPGDACGYLLYMEVKPLLDAPQDTEYSAGP